MTEAEAMMRKNIEKMNENVGYDVIIVCCSSSQQARYWQKRLEDGRYYIYGDFITLYCVGDHLFQLTLLC